MTTSQGDDRVGTTEGPEHTGLFEAGTDDGSATGFDHAGADKQVLAAKLGVAHARGVALKVIRLNANLFQKVGIG